MLGALPGIREIRSALAGGYLWIAFLWLALDPGLGKTNFRGEPYRSAHHLGNDIGPIALGVTLTFVAYLIGTFFNEMRGVIARIYLRARQSASGRAPGNRRSEAVKLSKRRRARRRQRRQTRLRRLKTRRERREQVVRRWRNLKRPTLTAIAYEVGRSFIETINILGKASESIAMIPTLLAEDVIDGFEALQALLLVAVRRVSSIRIEPYKPFVSEDGVAAISRYLDDSQQTRMARELDKDNGDSSEAPRVADVIADFPIIRTRLIHRSPDTASEYDRLLAEADFRSAIVPPLFAILVIFALEISWIWSLTALILLVLMTTARRKRREAGDILADTLGVVDAPCIEEAARRQASMAAGALSAPQG